MADVYVRTRGDRCRHHFVQKGKSYGKEQKSFIVGLFECHRCGARREFAVGMTGYWFARKRMEGCSFV